MALKSYNSAFSTFLNPGCSLVKVLPPGSLLSPKTASYYPAAAAGAPLSNLEQVFSASYEFWIRKFSVVGGCPVHFRMFSSIPGLNPPDTNGIILNVVTTENVSRDCQLSPWGAESTLVACHYFRRSQSPTRYNLDLLCLVP